MRPVVASQVLLPVGDLHKTAVRKLAADELPLLDEAEAVICMRKHS